MKFLIDHNVCLNTSYDLAIIREGLLRASHQEVTASRDADLLVFGACGVRGVWLEEAIKAIDQHLQANAGLRVIMTSCAHQIDPDRAREWSEGKAVELMTHERLMSELTPFSFEQVEAAMPLMAPELMPPTQSKRDVFGPEVQSLLKHLAQVDEECGTDLEGDYRSTTKGLLFYREEKSTVFAVVSRGCPFRCSFCAIPTGRGPFRCVPLEQVRAKVTEAAGLGAKRVYLVGEDVGSYRCPATKAGFSDLLGSVLSAGSDLVFGLRFLEPMSFLRHYDGILEACGKGRISLIYLPLQSGSKRLLGLMKRTTDVKKLTEAIDGIRKCSDTVFYTNWMVGFPTETPEEFKETLNLAKRLRLNVNAVIPYSKRPCTPAAFLGSQVPVEVKKQRAECFKNEMARLKAEMLLGGCDAIPTAVRESLFPMVVSAEVGMGSGLYD